MAAKFAVAALALPAATMARALPQVEAQDGKIVGGEPAQEGDFPFIVSLSQGGSHFCGGSLLNANTVLTAAHCSEGQDPASVQVRAGSLLWAEGGVQVGVSEILVHPDYDSSATNNDVAIWKLSEEIPEGDGITFATLPADGSDPEAGALTTVAGWGTQSSGSGSLPDELYKVQVPVVARDVCKEQYGADAITDAMFCAAEEEGGQDSCQGDSGGPITDDASGALVGVVSWGQGCAEAGFAGVYANVGALLSFISANL